MFCHLPRLHLLPRLTRLGLFPILFPRVPRAAHRAAKFSFVQFDCLPGAYSGTQAAPNAFCRVDKKTRRPPPASTRFMVICKIINIRLCFRSIKRRELPVINIKVRTDGLFLFLSGPGAAVQRFSGHQGCAQGAGNLRLGRHLQPLPQPFLQGLDQTYILGHAPG